MVTTGGVEVGGALSFRGPALLSVRQRSAPPAGPGSHGSDLHLGEVQGHQVALPRFPIHSLTAGKPIRRERKREKPNGWLEGGDVGK